MPDLRGEVGRKHPICHEWLGEGSRDHTERENRQSKAQDLQAKWGNLEEGSTPFHNGDDKDVGDAGSSGRNSHTGKIGAGIHPMDNLCKDESYRWSEDSHIADTGRPIGRSLPRMQHHGGTDEERTDQNPPEQNGPDSSAQPRTHKVGVGSGMDGSEEEARNLHRNLRMEPALDHL